MERLTQKENDKLIMVKQDNGEYIPAYWNEDNFKAIKKLADYEDLEEQGLLVRLPCKVGDSLYCIIEGTVKKLKACSFIISDSGIIDIDLEYEDAFYCIKYIRRFSENVFFTHEEAEKKLEELKND